jgi:PilZ domain
MFLRRIFRSDRRRWERLRLNAPVQLLTGSERFDGRGVKLSPGGMCLFTVSDLPIGSEVELEFLTPSSEKTVRVSGTIRSRALYLYGIEFSSYPRNLWNTLQRHDA